MKKHLADGSGTSFRLCHQAEAATYAVRCMCVQRSVYVRTAFDVRAYDVRCTSPSGCKAMVKRLLDA